MDYYSLFLDYPDKMELLLIFLLAMMRLAPIVVLAPFLGGKMTPVMAKMGLLVALSAIFLPHMVFQIQEQLYFNIPFIMLCIKELFIGTLLGYFISMPFFIANSAGVLIDHQRGTASFTALDPSSGNQASPIGVFYNYVLILLFFQIGGPWFFLDSVTLSYSVVPPDKFLAAGFFASTHVPIWESIINLANIVLTIATQLAAPALVAMFMTDLFLGIANRLAPQVPMSFLGWSLKSLFGVGILYLGWWFILGQMQEQTMRWLDMTRSFTHHLAG